MVDITILVLGVVLSIITGLFVYARNPRHIVNRIYGLMTISLIGFAIGNFFSLRTLDRLFYIRAVIFFSTIIVACLYYMVVFLGSNEPLSKLRRFGVWFSVLVAILDFTPLVFSGLRDPVNPVPVPNFAAGLFLGHLIIFLAASCTLLIQRTRKSHGVIRLQYLYMLFGALPLFVFAPVTGFAMPVVFKNASLIFLSPVYTTFFVCLIGYAIVRHRLFDIKLIIARSLAYAGTILALAVIYGFLFFGTALVVFKLHFSLAFEVFFSVATGVAALGFQRLKTIFDKITNRLFYRDAYDPQVLFEEFNRVLVSTIDLEALLRGTTDIIARYLKAQFCIIGIKDGSASGRRIIGTQMKDFPPSEIAQLRHMTPHIPHTVISVDDLLPDQEKLRKIMTKNDIAILARLTPNVLDGEEGLGYIVLGAKKSGNPYTTQDIKVMTTIANGMLIAVQNALHFEEIERFNETLQEKIDEATRKLRRTNDKLKLLDETKDDFISMASHQLRTPLTSVKGYVSMVLDGDAGKINGMQRKLLNQSFISAQRMVYLISDLLNVSRLRTGKFLIEPISTNLADVIKGEVNQLIETAEGRNLTLTFNAPQHFPTLMMDETKTRQVIMNFIDNAIYYTPAGGHITVNLVEKPQTIEFTVEDDGIGVPKHEQHHLFSKFYRAENAKRARPDGTGLGLFMAKKVIVAQGGAIIFKSQEKKGSTFGFSFAKEKLLPSHNTVVHTDTTRK
jgi:signal transduction histidine kinase